MTHLLMPIVVLVVAALVLTYSVFQFAHARLLDADMAEIERLHAEGLLDQGTTSVQDFDAVCALLNDIAPAVYMRQEVWIRAYFMALRTCRLVLRSSAAIEKELARLTAYQAMHYRVARTRLAAIRTQ